MLLHGVRVLDLSRLLPGGYATRLLLEQGATIVKVESPEGDPIRRMPAGEALFEALHRGKQLLTLDLKSVAGRDQLGRMLADVDVIVEGFRPGVMEHLDLGYAKLSGIQPRLVYCAITGYGSNRPQSSRAGHDLNYLALSGALALMPRKDGLPMIPGLQLADMAGGLQAAFLVSSALAARGSSGRGARLEVSMTALMGSWTLPERAAREAGLAGLGLSGEYPCYRVYRVSDGWISVAALESRFWRDLCIAIGRPELVSRQFDQKASVELEQVFKTASRGEWVERLAGHDVCVEPVLQLDELSD